MVTILEGTDIRSVINLSMTRADFDQLLEFMTYATGVTIDDDNIGGALLRFRATFKWEESS